MIRNADFNFVPLSWFSGNRTRVYDRGREVTAPDQLDHTTTDRIDERRLSTSSLDSEGELIEYFFRFD